ncbi:MAG: LysM peptidoglycan-binding domain-containing protein [Acidobacteriia bacterium]|nr:LysM peptidoglycan-binding domain-containing protein [Terriglobia bacterium]
MAQTEDQLKAKYQTVLTTIHDVNGSLKNVNMEGEKLFIRAEVANDQTKNHVWDVIKEVDPSYSDLHADIVINSSLTPPATAPAASGGAQRTYTVQPGDTLSKIAEQFYGKASAYNKIFEANRHQLSDADHIRAGQELVIPA